MDVEALAKSQTEVIASRLKLDEKQTKMLMEQMVLAGKESTPLRQQCQNLEVKITRVYEQQMASVVGTFNEEQQEAYEKLVAEGRGLYSGCSVGASSAKCAEEGKSGAKAACCAGGKAHGEAKLAEPAKPSDTGKPVRK